MSKLLKIELIKLLNYTSFKIIIGLHFVLFSLVVFISSRIQITVPGFDPANLFRFPHIWNFFPWIASWFNLLLAVLIIIFAGNEFSFSTFRQHVIDGLGRMELLGGKLLVILLIALYSFLLVLLSGTIYGLIYSNGFSVSLFFTNIEKVLIYFLQAFSYMVIGLMLVMLLRNTALSVILFLLLRFPVEPVIRSFFSPAVRPFFPMKVIGGLTPVPEFLRISSENTFPTAGEGNALTLSEIGIVSQGLPLYLLILLAIGYTALSIFITIVILKKRNL